MSYNYPANVTVLSSTATQPHHHGASAAPAPNASSAAAAAAASAGGSRRWSSFHHPENKFNQLHAHTQSYSSGGAGASREDTISAWRDLRGSAVDEEDADVDAVPVPAEPPKSAPAFGTRDRQPPTGYVQF